MGLPSLVISIAENQVPICKALALNNFIKYCGDANELKVADIELALDNILAESIRWRDLGVGNQVLVDGQGASRVAEALIPTDAADLTLRPADKTDALNYFAWINDLGASPSNNTSDVFDLVTYLQWFNRRLSDENCFLYVLEAQGLPIGQLRFDIFGDNATIYYSLESLVRGRGWEKNLLKLGIEAINTSRPYQLKNLDGLYNIESLSLFIRLGLDENDTKVKMPVFSVAIISDESSWLNDWLPEMISNLLKSGHRVLWAHKISALRPADYCFYLSFSKIVSKNIRDRFLYNLVVHESDLPQGKGWSPLTWQILEGKGDITVSLIEAEDKVYS
jgi:hypothetical protein